MMGSAFDLEPIMFYISDQVDLTRRSQKEPPQIYGRHNLSHANCMRRKGDIQ